MTTYWQRSQSQIINIYDYGFGVQTVASPGAKDCIKRCKYYVYISYHYI